MADGGGKWRVIESEMDRFEKEISSLARQPNFIPAQLRRPMPPPPPPSVMAGSMISRPPGPGPAIISGAPKVYSSEPTTIAKAGVGLNSPASPTIRPMIPKQALFQPISSSPVAANSTGSTQQTQQDPIVTPLVTPITSSSSNSASTETPSSSTKPVSTDRPEKKKKAKKPKEGEGGKPKKLVRCAGGQVWEDTSLQDWDPSDFRLFCGDLGNDVTDEVLTRVFGRYPSFQKAKVIRDKRTNKTKGYGFVSFKDPNDFVRAIRELDGRYVGSRPIKLRKSNWRNRNIDQARKRERERNSLIGIKKSGKQRYN